MAETRGQSNRRVRQEALRQWLSEKCTAQHLIDNLEKIEGLDPASEVFVNELNKYKVANDQRLKVMNKYIPDLKQADLEVTGEDGGPVGITGVQFVGVSTKD